MHGLSSSQSLGVPEQVPPEHLSFVVHASPSLHVLASLSANTHRPSAAHESSVQSLLSSQSASLSHSHVSLTSSQTSAAHGGVPVWQVPFWHVSSPLQKELSGHGVPAGS